MTMTTEKPKRKQTWNEKRKAHVPKPITAKSEQGEIKTYQLSPEELEYYRNLKPPIAEKHVCTLAPRERKAAKLRSRNW